MLTKEVAAGLNEQINAELYSAYLYLAMSAYAGYNALPGVANWFWIQAMEESTHSKKIYDYINSHGARVVLDAIEKPPEDFASVTAMFQQALEHEQHVTARFNNLMSVAAAAEDNATKIYLEWFITEQVEEEQNVQTILDQLKLAGDTGPGLFMVDRDLGTRVFQAPGAQA